MSLGHCYSNVIKAHRFPTVFSKTLGSHSEQRHVSAVAPRFSRSCNSSLGHAGCLPFRKYATDRQTYINGILN
jgi:hypothetical protein